MKKLLLTGILLFVYFLMPEASAQNFQPFNQYKTHHFISRDSIYSMRMVDYQFSGGKELFYFNSTAKKGIIRTGNQNCIGISTTYHAQPNNQFGERMEKQANGDYTFVVKHGSSIFDDQMFLLKTNVSIGQSWPLNVPLNINATLVSQATETFDGITDTVLTYSLSNGHDIKLSKNHGFVKVPNFAGYVPQSGFPKRTLDFYHLSDSYFDEAISSPFKIFDFQPNDQFCYYKTQRLPSGLCGEEWNQYKILTRRNSIGGDSIIYTREHQRIYKINSWCGSFMATPNILPPVIDTLIITSNSYPETWLLSNEHINGFRPNATSFFFPRTDRALVSTAIKKSAKFNQREEMLFKDLAYAQTSCGQVFHYTPDLEFAVSYAVGLGKTEEWVFPMSNIDEEVLQGYVKGAESYGVCVDFAQIMATAEELEEFPFRIFPNPFSNELSLKLNPEFQKGKLEITITNLLGQQVSEQKLNKVNQPEVKLELPDLPKGIYMVQVSQNGKTYTSKLVKE